MSKIRIHDSTQESWHTFEELTPLDLRGHYSDKVHASLRAKIVPSARGALKKKAQRGEGVEATPRHVAMTWAQRLKRVFLIDVTVCEHCGGAVKIIACIEDKVTVRKILAQRWQVSAARRTLPAMCAASRSSSAPMRETGI